MKRFFLFSLLLLLPLSAQANQTFESWLKDLHREARAQGISPQTLKALDDVKPLPRVLALDRKQPEGKLSFARYKKRTITQPRIDRGRALMKQHHALLEKASAQYGVPASMIVALWGIETSYGKNTGGFDVIAALATLAYDGRRSDYFRKELLIALRIIDQGHIIRTHMKGSWAGAMGQNQFMPGSFEKLAVDGNKDGRKDIWNSLPDVFASTAHYLRENGWQAGQRWGRKVQAPMLKDQTGLKVQKTLVQWQALGVRLPDGKDLPQDDDIKASLLQPDGAGGQSYLVYDNFRVIMRWNKSTSFALSAGILSDLINKPQPNLN